MAVRKLKALKALAIFLIFCFAQVYVQAGLGNPGTLPQGARLITARLTTRGGAALLNGVSSTSGATVLTGAAIETPDNVSATVDLGPLGTLDIAPNTSLQLDYTDTGARVNLKRGCALLKVRGNATGEVYTDQGASEKTDNNRKSLGFCFLNGQLSPGSVSTVVPMVSGTTAGTGLTHAELIAILAGGGATAALLIIGLNGGTGRGANPSP